MTCSAIFAEIRGLFLKSVYVLLLQRFKIKLLYLLTLKTRENLISLDMNLQQLFAKKCYKIVKIYSNCKHIECKYIATTYDTICSLVVTSGTLTFPDKEVFCNIYSCSTSSFDTGKITNFIKNEPPYRLLTHMWDRLFNRIFF